MKQADIDRINELYHKSKQQGLTEEEKIEQEKLRKEYINSFKNNMTSILDNTYIIDENGNKKKLKQ